MGLLIVAKAKATILTELKKLERMDLFIFDDFRMQLFDTTTARMNLLDVIKDQYAKKTTIIRSQIPQPMNSMNRSVIKLSLMWFRHINTQRS